MSSYVQEVYKARCDAAEEAANRVRELTATVMRKFKRMSKQGVLYASAERAADTAALEKAQKDFEAILASVFEIEDAERS